MDQVSNQIVEFICALNERHEKLRPFVNRICAAGNEVEWNLTLGGHPFSIFEVERRRDFTLVFYWMITVTPKTERVYIFSLEVLCDGSAWLITGSASVEAEIEGIDLLRSFPERSAETADGCLAPIDLAIEDLISCYTLLPA